MARKKQKEASVDEMLVVLGPLLSPSGASDNLSIPGMNAYVPSVVAGGTRLPWREDGQLESDPQRNQLRRRSA